MPEEIHQFKKILAPVKCAFDSTTDKEIYLHLMYLLGKDSELTQRELAMVIGSLFDLAYVNFLNDVYHAVSPSFVIDDNVLEDVRRKLAKCGFEATNQASL
jgi:hypothetical protein